MDSISSLEWAKSELESSGQGKVTSDLIVADTAWSQVRKLSINATDYYLKVNPSGLTLEPDTIAKLREIGVTAIPEVICDNPALNCFIMKACGDISLRTYFDGTIDISILCEGLGIYSSIQRLCDEECTSLLAMGIPDWRLECLPELYKELLGQQDILLADGLLSDEFDRLNTLERVFIEKCKHLKSFCIPQTLDHCDFHANNILINQKTRQITIIDWVETVITHPFFSLNGCLWNACYFSGMKKESEDYIKLQQHCIKPWLDIASSKELRTAFSIAYELSGVYVALGYKRLHQATKEQNNSTQNNKKGAITGCLQTFIKAIGAN